MSGDSSSARALRLARALLAAEDEPALLGAWLSNASIPADLVALVDSETGTPILAFRREGPAFLPVPVPPVSTSRRPTEPVTVNIGADRADAFDDLVFSLGLEHLLLFPLEPDTHHFLALGSVRSGGDAADLERLREDATLLAPALGQVHRRRLRQDTANGSADEVAEIFELTRELARAGDPAHAMSAAAESLRRQLQPAAGAIIAELVGGDEAIIESWPESAAGQEAVGVAAGTEKGSLLTWISPPSTSVHVRLAVGWPGQPPSRAARITEASLASLSMAIDRLEGQRVREEDRLQETVEGLPLGVVLLNRRGRVRLVNRAGRRLLQDLGAWPGSSGLLLKLGSTELAPMIAEAASGTPASAEIYFPDDSRTLDVRVVPSPRGVDTPSGDGKVDVLVVLEDVTESLRQKRHLVQAEKLSALGTLISGVVHELNNPLSTILGYAQMLVSVPEAPSRGEWMKTILEEGQRCHRIVNNMLALARRHEGGLQMVSLKAISEKALSLLAYPYRTAGIDSSLRADSDTPAVQGDQDALLQVLINLLTNSLHALEGHDGRREVRVEIGPADGDDDDVILSVSDTGPGIPPSLKDQVFDPFFTTKEEGKGTGLGLSQVASTIADHKGRIELLSEPGHGASFRIHLPSAEARDDTEVESDEAQLPLATSLGGARVAIIDDEPAVAECLADVLDHSGARVRTYSDAEDALSSMLQDVPDVIVSDLRMPRLSGEGLLEELSRRSPQLVERLVFTTGDVGAMQTSTKLRVSNRPCLAKPFDFKEVVRVVADVYSSRVTPRVPPSWLPPVDGTGLTPDSH